MLRPITLWDNSLRSSLREPSVSLTHKIFSISSIVPFSRISGTTLVNFSWPSKLAAIVATAICSLLTFPASKAFTTERASAQSSATLSELVFANFTSSLVFFIAFRPAILSIPVAQALSFWKIRQISYPSCFLKSLLTVSAVLSSVFLKLPRSLPRISWPRVRSLPEMDEGGVSLFRSNSETKDFTPNGANVSSILPFHVSKSLFLSLNSLPLNFGVIPLREASALRILASRPCSPTTMPGPELPPGPIPPPLSGLEVELLLAAWVATADSSFSIALAKDLPCSSRPVRRDFPCSTNPFSNFSAKPVSAAVSAVSAAASAIVLRKGTIRLKRKGLVGKQTV